MYINDKIKLVHEQAEKIYNQAEEYNIPLLDDLIKQLKELREPYLIQMEDLESNQFVILYKQAKDSYDVIQDYIGWLISYYPK